MAKSKYHYKGPVYRCDKYVCDWEGYTWAPTEAKALSNLSFRFKTEAKLIPGTKIILDSDYLSESTAIWDMDEVDDTYHQMTLQELYGI